MNVDPLCPQQHTHPKHNPNRCIFCEYGAAVRVDALQAAREAVDKLPTDQTVREGVSEFWVEINDALSAIDRAAGLAIGGPFAGPPIPIGDGCVLPSTDALAAIDALREKP